MAISINMLSDRRRQAWVMRYRYGRQQQRIALEMGISQSCVSRLLFRGMLRAGLPHKRNVRILSTKPRLATVLLLSEVVEQV